MYDKERAPTDEMVSKYRFLSPMLDSALKEMRDFSKKKNEGIVSATKIKILNRILNDIRGILADEPSIVYLETFNEDDLPENSDAVLVLGQYRAAMDSFKSAHFRNVDSYHQAWVTKEWIADKEAEKDERDEDDLADDEDSEDDESENK